LPARSERGAEAIAIRAREKEIVKRRLGKLAEASAEVRGLIDRSIDRLNGTAGQPRSFDALDRLLNVQSYRLAHWRGPSQQSTYCRVFGVNPPPPPRRGDTAAVHLRRRLVLA